MDGTVIVYNIMLHIKRTSSVLDKTPLPFYPFGSEAEYIQVLQQVSYKTSNYTINKWFNDIRF